MRRQVRLPSRRIEFTADALNLFDREYVTTGYPDPSGSGVSYFYPAAGRTLRVAATLIVR